MKLRELILSLVDSATKGTELVTSIVFDFYQSGQSGKLDAYEILETLDKLVAEGELIEIEYTLPASTYKIKSIYFPKGTEIKIRIAPKASLSIDNTKVKLIKRGDENGT